MAKSMILRSFLVGIACGLGSIATAAAAVAATEGDDSLSVLHQGIPHDALYDVCFNGNRGIAVGVAGTVLNSADAGLTWQPQPGFTDLALLGVSCEGERNIVVGQAGTIFVQEADGWKQVESGTENRLLSVKMNANGLAFAVGGFGAVLRSTDGGLTWAPVDFDWQAILNDFLEPHIFDVAISDQGVVTLVGEFELILRSEDSGDTWTPVNKADASLNSVYFSDVDNGYAVGQKGRILKTADGGLTWSVVDAGSPEILLDVWSSPTGEVVITGIREMLRSDDFGQTWRSVEGGDISVKWYQAINVATAGAEHNVVMVGHSGRIVKIN